MLARAGAEAAPDAWRRGVAFLLDSLRTEAAHQPLPAGPLTQQVYAVMSRLTGSSGYITAASGEVRTVTKLPLVSYEW